MSDIIYPGIVTVRADPAVSQNDLIQYLHKTIGSDSSLYQDGEPKIEIFEPTRKGRSSVTVVISGILLPLAEIRRRFGRNKLVGRYFFIQSPDFGIPREWKNQFEFQKNILHNNLKKSQGILSPIKLFQKSFTSSFGTLTTFTETIFFNDVARNVNTAALEYLPGLILYNDTMHKSSSGTYDAAVKLKYENMEIVFSNRMEALQAVCWLNDNSGFSSKRRRFLTYSGGGECGLRGVVKVGTDAQPLNIAAEMEINGYIPWEKLNRKTVWSDQQLENLDTVCFICDTHYSIKGVGPDISWLAATCKCPTEGSNYTWHNEKFFRMTLPVTKNVVQYKFEYVNDRKTDQLIRLVPGLTPLYDNVEKFRKSALAAYGCDFKNEKRMLHYQQTKGKVISTNLIEETLVRGKKTKRVKATVSVMQSKLWCSDGIHKIQDVLLVHELNKITTYASTRRTRSQIIPAKLYNISNFGHTTCEVTLVAAVRRGSFIEEGQEMMLIPKPPAYEKNSLRHTFTRWKKVVDRRISPPRKLSGSIIASNYCRDTVWENGLELYSVYLVHVNVERKPVWQYLKSRLADCYVGAEAELLVSIGPKKLCTLHTIRIVSIYDPTEVNVGELQTPINTIPLAVSFVVVLNGAQIVDIGSDCTMAVWVIASSLYSLETHHGQLNIAAGAEDYFDDDNFVEQSDNDSDQQDWTEKKSVFLTFDTKYVFVHEDKSLPGQSTDDLRLILDEWCSEPDYSIPFLDFLLVLPKGTLVTRVGNFDETCMNKVSVQRLLQRLDESQKKAVETMLRWKLSITQGPPGSGKTLMLGYGVAILRSISEGLIIVCTQSNCAADEAYEKIASVNRQFKLGIRVLRMLGQKRERVDSQKETPSTERPYFLHERVRSHYKWVRDEEINDIIEKEIYEGATALTLDEANKLRGHLMRVTRTVLLRTDVVVCTVACASDYRLKSTLDIMRKIKRPLSALILDESSLLTVPATLPILTFNPLRVWLIGDDKQLRPTVRDQSALNACLDVSWMEFLRLTPYVKNNPQVFSMLRTQYRLPDPCATVVSHFMYDGQVVSAASVLSRNYSNNIILKQFPELGACNMAWYTYGEFGESKEKSEHSKYNLIEVDITIHLVQQLETLNWDPKSICIIAMYERQTAILKQRFSQLGGFFNNLNVLTVDASQGKEFSVVILNWVRSNKGHNLGFLRCKRRMNVSISRQKNYLLLVGHLPTLYGSKLPDFLQLIGLQHNQQIRVKEFSYSTTNCQIEPHNSYNPIAQYLQSHGMQIKEALDHLSRPAAV